jgi:hypothetical protein
MKVTFRQSGGLAGICKGCELDTGKMPAADRAALEALVRRSGVDVSADLRSPAARDATAYEIAVHSEAGTWRVAADDLSLSGPLRPLVRFLAARARPQPPG